MISLHSQKHKTRISFDIFIFFPPPVFIPLSPPPFSSFFLPFLALGGGEDNRQNPAESDQSTEGELVFYGHLVTLMSW